MSVKAIREYDGKKIMQALCPKDLGLQMCLVTPETMSKPDPWTTLSDENPWLLTKKLVAKPEDVANQQKRNQEHDREVQMVEAARLRPHQEDSELNQKRTWDAASWQRAFH